jgi:uncharacterized membrane protein
MLKSNGVNYLTHPHIITPYFVLFIVIGWFHFNVKDEFKRLANMSDQLVGIGFITFFFIVLPHFLADFTSLPNTRLNKLMDLEFFYVYLLLAR